MLGGPTSIETSPTELLDQCASSSTNLRELSAQYLAKTNANTANWKVTEFTKALRQQIHEIVGQLSLDALKDISTTYICPHESVEAWLRKGRETRTTSDLLPHIDTVTERSLIEVGNRVLADTPKWQQPYVVAHALLRSKTEGIITIEIWERDKDYRTRVLRALDNRIAGSENDDCMVAYFRDAAKQIRHNDQTLNLEVVAQTGKRSGQLCKEEGKGALGIDPARRSEISRKIINDIIADPKRELARREAISHSRRVEGAPNIGQNAENVLLWDLVHDKDNCHLEGPHKNKPNWKIISTIFNQLTGREASATTLRSFYCEIAKDDQKLRADLLTRAADKVRDLASNLSSRMLGARGRSLADDFLHDALIRALDHYDPKKAAPESYLIAAVRYRIIDESRRKHSANSSINLVDPDGEDLGEIPLPNLSKLNDPLEAAVESEVSELVAKSIHSLPEDYRRIVNLVINENLSIPEVAVRESITPVAAKYRFGKACEALAEKLRDAA